MNLTYCTRTTRIDGTWPDARGVGGGVYGCGVAVVVVVVSKTVRKTRNTKMCMRKKTRRGKCR
jgi:hypothetical protein